MKAYDHKKIEKKWQKEWERSGLYQTREDSSKPKSYVLDMFPYPSGEGLHVGHPKGYIATDIYSRYKKMTGHDVLHPMGWDAFGLPAENFALKNKVHPRMAVEKNKATFKSQLGRIGFNYDWSREINTTDPAYYKWTQWIFIQLFKKGLAYISNEPINWCPSCKTGLANEDLEGNECERCGTVVEKKKLPQWVLRITDYAERLLTDLDTLPWPEYIKEMQRNWIGRSRGALIPFEIRGSVQKNAEKGHGQLTKSAIEVFTTRPDTLFGATYIVLAPEHPFVRLTKSHIANWEEVEKYIEQAAQKTEMERTTEEREKTGVEIGGVKAINPATKEEIPVFIADYVLAHYGTGAIMAVPAHDERDYAFAKKHDLSIRQVVAPCFVRTEGEDAVREGEPVVEREAITAVIKHWRDEKYIVLKWKKVDWHTFLTGGVEGTQTPEDAARAEICEETGYTNIRTVRELSRFCAKFFHVPKKENRLARFHAFYFELIDDARVGVSKEEAEKHEVLWLTQDELQKVLTPPGHIYAWNELQSGFSPYTGEGILISSGSFSNIESDEAKQKITKYVGGKTTTTYKLRDWVFSRQRYWGEPIPIIHCKTCGAVPVPEEDLPVVLPEVESYEPTGTGESPLAGIEDWVNVPCPACGGRGTRETNTMPQWAGSSWYYLRYMDPHNDETLVSKEKEAHWAPVDVYVGGAEHATRHLIYARFWHKFLHDIGVVSTKEPFTELHSVGLIMAEDGKKMSKRYGNVINPDDIVEVYGADTLRVYEMFMGPFNQAISWSAESMMGARRFLERLWRLSEKMQPNSVQDLDTALSRTIKKVGEDIAQFKFNTAIAQMMTFINEAEKAKHIGKDQLEAFLKILAPFAPHITEELWHILGHEDSIHTQPWPPYDELKLVSDTVHIPVQINGKVRAQLEIAVDSERGAVESAARTLEQVQKWLGGKAPQKVIYVPNRLINFVI